MTDTRSGSAEFLRGATAVLAHLKMSEGNATGVLYHECAQFIGVEALVRQARRDGAMRWSGLAEYMHYRRNP